MLYLLLSLVECVRYTPIGFNLLSSDTDSFSFFVVWSFFFNHKTYLRFVQFRYFLQPFLVLYYAPLFIIRGLTGPSRKVAKKKRDTFMEGWKSAIDYAEKTEADGYWPVHANGKKKTKAMVQLLYCLCNTLFCFVVNNEIEYVGCLSHTKILICCFVYDIYCYYDISYWCLILFVPCCRWRIFWTC